MSIALNVKIKGNGYPILCLHGHPGSAGSMSVFTDHFCQRWQTLAPDLRGYGKSRYRRDFQLEEHLEDLIELLDRQKIQQCLILGWSLGGIIALELVLRHPDRFAGLILVASAGRPWGSHPPVTTTDLVLTGIAAILNQIKPGWRWNIDTFARRSTSSDRLSISRSRCCSCLLTNFSICRSRFKSGFKKRLQLFKIS